MPAEITMAIDPGASGGIAWQTIYSDGRELIEFENMPETRESAIEFFRELDNFCRVNQGTKVRIIIEKIVPFCPGAGAAHMFNYGSNVERVVIIPMALGFDVTLITPQNWQKTLNLGSSKRVPVPAPPRLHLPKDAPSALRAKLRKQHKLTVQKFEEEHADEIKRAQKFNAQAKAEWKRYLCQKAKEFFPNADVTLKTCDALLLLAYATGKRITTTEIAETDLF